jgi:hypothetical protein
MKDVPGGPTRDTQLPFVIELLDGSEVATMGDVESCFRDLTDDQREANHWAVAVRMFANAMTEPAYLKAATLSLQTAFAMDGLLTRMDTGDDAF